MKRLSAADRADLRDLVQILAELMGYERDNVWARKLCSKCRRVKPLAEFNRDRATPDGFSYRCRACQKAARVR